MSLLYWLKLSSSIHTHFLTYIYFFGKDFLTYICMADNQDFLGDDFKSQGSHVPYNMADFSTQVHLELTILI